MAKFRRIVRRVEPHGEASFDDQLWPVNLALFVLGGFLVGAVLVYLRFDDPRWQYNAWTSLLVIVVVIGGGMLALRHVSSRLIRRTMQLAIVVSTIVHLLFILGALQVVVFSRIWSESTTARELVERPPPVVAPDYPQFQMQGRDRPKQDFEKPVETETVEIQAEEVVRREELQREQSPQQQQPTPVPEPEQTVQPNVVKRREAEATVPRRSEQPSQLSRQQANARPLPNSFVAAPRPDPTAPPQPATVPEPTTAVARRPVESPAAPRRQIQEPAPVASQPLAHPNRRAAQVERQAPAASSARLPRSTSTAPAVAGGSQVASEPPPTIARQTDADAPRPDNTDARKQVTASPPQEAARRQPAPDIAVELARQLQRRQHPSPLRPHVAQTPASVGERTVRVTPRPDVQTVAEATQPRPTPPQRTANEPGAVGIARQTVSRPLDRAGLAQPTTARNRNPNVVAGAGRPTAAEVVPAPQTVPAPSSLVRQRGQPSPALSTQVEVTRAAAVTQRALADQLSPTGTATRKQQTARPQVAQRAGDPAVSAVGQLPSTSASPSSARGSSQQARPTIEAPRGSLARRSTSRQAQATVVAQGPRQNSAPVAATDAAPSQASISSVARQSLRSPTATRGQLSAGDASSSPQTQLAAPAAVARASVSRLPSLHPQAAASASPARAAINRNTPASPSSADQPAIVISSPSSSPPAAEARPTALAKSTVGTAGMGRSVNVDRGQPAAESPALVASGSARRAEPVQTKSAGPDLSPSEPARVSRTRAGADRPATTLQAQQPVLLATDAGAARAEQLQATSSATVARQVSDAASGAVTAAKGQVEVDLGPTRLVSSHQKNRSRAAGGGQPRLNFQAQVGNVKRNADGGAVQAALPMETLAEAPTAPKASGGGQPPAVEASPLASANQRIGASDRSPASGGPSRAVTVGPVAEANSAQQLADLQLRRTDATANRTAEVGAPPQPLGEGRAEGAPDSPADRDGQQQRGQARRLARRAEGGAAALPLAGAVLAEQPATPAADRGEGRGLTRDQARMIARAETAKPPTSTRAAAGPAEAATGPVGGRLRGEIQGPLEVDRAEPVQAAVGPPLAGGGSDSPIRRASGPQLVANLPAPIVTRAGAPDSSGDPEGRPIKASGTEIVRRAGGLLDSEGVQRAAGTPADPILDAPSTPAPGAVAGQSAVSRVADPGPSVDQLAESLASVKRTSRAPPAAVTNVNPQVEGPPTASEEEAIASLVGGTQIGPLARSSVASLRVDIEAPDGPGGLAAVPATRAGVNQRRAQSDSLDVQVQATRFVRKQAGGLPDFNSTVVVATEPFQRRAARKRGNVAGGGEGWQGPQTERAIELGLVFLQRHQLPDGSWSLKGYTEQATMDSDTAATGLALLAFQGAGYNHKEHKYAKVVDAGIRYLVDNQQENGDLFVRTDGNSNRYVWLYSHSIAALALCEAYGMTQDPDLRGPAQKAIDFIVKTQHRDLGGWRYAPQVSSDTSVTGWMMMAIKSGQLANLDVPQETFDNISHWLDAAQASTTQRHLYCYNPIAEENPRQRHGRSPSKTMTSVGLLMRLYTGWRRDNQHMVNGAQYLLERLPALGSARESPLEKQRDTYYWYYATQVMYHMRGTYWQQWNSRLHPLLVNYQLQQGPLAGSWDPLRPVADRWGPQAGRLYVTTMNLLSLEVAYRILPLYEHTAE